MDLMGIYINLIIFNDINYSFPRFTIPCSSHNFRFNEVKWNRRQERKWKESEAGRYNRNIFPIYTAVQSDDSN